ncbi:uncharacterized protein AB675_253 [Cyphellophora attinorum]|uniref:G domain-containing protein n=1 Tax=Cyphellophora attinorum TaxID=1664694 RepID=A0A0N1HH93_9EURO|nr:uncharacterized protein AB675_253 [Phialophora attinorum]KPI45820.1 hypothetical protein AB675_253 [Phialophora attinorum]
MNGNVSESDAVKITAIAVMGMTGSGKSNFIKHATQSAQVKVGHHLSSCTENVEEHEFLLGGNQVVLFDTPGFDDADRLDADILAELGQKLSAMYKNKLRLAGIIYVHKITDTRVTRTVRRNLSLLMDLCGDDPLKNLTLLTSFWDETDRVHAQQKEKELVAKKEWWGYMVEKGAAVRRFMNTEQSAHDIIWDYVTKDRVTLQIQEEMVDGGLDIKHTKAGAALDAEVAQLLKQHEKELEDVRQRMEQARREQKLELEEMLAVERREKEHDLRRMQEEQRALERDRSAEMRRMEQDFQDSLLRLVEDKKERDSKLDALQEQLTLERADADQRIRAAVESSESNLRIIVSNIEKERAVDRKEHMQQVALYQKERDDAVAQYKQELDLTNQKIQQMVEKQQSVSEAEKQRLEAEIAKLNKRKRSQKSATWTKIGGAALCTILAPLTGGLSMLFVDAFGNSGGSGGAVDASEPPV